MYRRFWNLYHILLICIETSRNDYLGVFTFISLKEYLKRFWVNHVLVHSPNEDLIYFVHARYIFQYFQEGLSEMKIAEFHFF